MVKEEKVEKLVKDWFAKTADYEWKHLKQDAYHHMFCVGASFKAEKIISKYLGWNSGK